MGVMDKFLNVMKFGDEDESEYYDEEEYVEETPKKTVEPSLEEKVIKPSEPKKAASPKRRTVTMNESSVCVFKPQSFEEAKEIAETLLSNNTVILNFEGVDLQISQRVLDIVTGTCIAIGGNLQKLSNYMFMATPASVDVSGEFQDTLTGAFENF
jgi:cell division inhibitor SepF